MQATGMATDPLTLSDTDVKTLAAPSGTTLRSVRSSFFATRINWSNAITETSQGPESVPDPYLHLVGPRTFGTNFTVVADCRTVGMRVMKMPAGNGPVTFLCWNSSGTLLASVSDTWVADGGGWREVEWPAPIEFNADEVYSFGFHYGTADLNYAYSVYVFNAQDTCVYPLMVSAAGPPAWSKDGASPTFTNVTGDKTWSNAYIDPVMEWDVDVPAYSHGNEYFDQFPNGGSRFDFPIGVFWADPPYHFAYKAMGVNTIWAGAFDDEGYAASIIAADLDWWPTLHNNNLSTPMAVQSDAALGAVVRGYFLTDEPDWITPFHAPSALRTWRNDCRRIDSTRPMHLNLSRIAQENQGFTWQPGGISAKNFNLQLREYMSLVDHGSLDCYGIARTYPYTYSGSDSGRYGIWIYPLVIQRMRTEITDERMPIWGVVETTSAYPDEPTPEQVKRAVWASLIPGARGIEYFDHRFAGAAVGQDFAAMLHDPPMLAALTALNAQMQTLAPALLADEANYIVSYESSGALAGAQGGYPAGADIPMHYTTRVVGGTTYFFCQSIRDGETTATFYVPGFQDAVLTVIGESRTVTVDADGYFVDDFDDGDYTYHLYSTTAIPSFTPPVNTVAPVLSTDGTPETGETVTCSTGTWTGAPTPSYTYQWQRAGVDIPGSTTSSYMLQMADEGIAVRCVVTATNTEGTDSENSNSITPTAPPPPGDSPYVTEVTADTAIAWWRLNDLTEEVGGLDLTNVGGFTFTTGLLDDDDDQAALANASGTARLTRADSAELRLGQGSFSVEFWVKPGYVAGNQAWVTKVGDFSSGIHSTAKAKFGPLGAGGWYAHVLGSTTLVVNTTYHIVGTWDFATKIMKIYVNGALDGTLDASSYGFAVSTSVWGPLDIGKNSVAIPDGYSDGMAPGTIDEVRLYNTALDASRIAAHYAAGI